MYSAAPADWANQRAEKSYENKSDGDANWKWCAWNDLQMIRKGIRRTGNQKKNQDHQDNNIVKKGQNTEESPWDLRRLAVTLTKDRVKKIN